MMFGIGAAASAMDLLKSLTSSKTKSGSANATPFDASTASSTGASSATGAGSAQSGCLSPGTLGAMLDAQGSAASASSTSDSARSKALKDLLSLLDGDGNGTVSKSEFESALGAGGTNTAAADGVFDKMDTDGDGAISLGELSKGLKGRHKPHKTDGSPPPDSLLNALDPATDASASTASASTAATTSYNFMERALQSQAQAFARSAMPQLSVSV